MAVSSRPKRRIILLGGVLFLAMVIQACLGQVTEPAPSIAPITPITPSTPSPTTAVSGIRLQGEVNPAQQAALNRLAALSSQPLEVMAHRGQVEYLSLGVKISDADAPTPQEKALLFLKQNREVFQYGKSPQNLKLDQQTTDESGNTMVQLSQQHQGVPVYGSGFLIFVGADDTIYSVQASYVPNLDMDIQPAIRSIHAEQTALDDLNAEDGKLAEATTLQIYEPAVWDPTHTELNPRLAWFVTISSESTLQLWLYIIDSQEGSILDRMDMILEAGGGFDFQIWENDAIAYWDYVLVLTDEETIKNENPSEFAWEAERHAYYIDYFYTTSFGRASYADAVDENVTPVEAELVMRVNLANCSITGFLDPNLRCAAYWDPEARRIYFAHEFTIFPDIVYHEFTHAVTGSEVALIFSGEPRELNEAFSDIFAALASRETEGIWQINWPVKDEDGKTILRDLQNVIQGFEYDYPKTYNERYCNRDDWNCLRKCPEKFGEYTESYPDCGHANSLVFSHAVYLMSEDADSQNGISRDRLKYLLYEVLTRWLTPAANQKTTANITVGVCGLNAKGVLQFTKLGTPFTIQECKKIEQAFMVVELIEDELLPDQPPSTPVATLLPTLAIPPTEPAILPLPTPPSEGLEEQIGTSIEKFINDLVQKVISEFNNLVDKFLNALKRDFLAFLEELGRNFINLISQQCCLGTMPLILLPSGWLVGRWRRKNSR
jgi:Zn-dependent metalloprotease